MAAALVAAAACAAPAPAARASATCGQGTYAYAGYDGRAAMAGVSATIEQAGPLAVHAGHVAGWIGVVDSRTGRAWLQVGLSAMPGQTTSAIYYEFSTPGGTPVYRQVEDGIAAGDPHSFAVVEQPWNPGWWVVWVDGRTAGAPLHLPGSHHRWTAQVLGESWAGARSGPCNAYSYAFDNVQLIRASGRLTPISGGLEADPNYVVADRTHAGFVAASFGLGDFRNAQIQEPARAPVPPQPAHTQ